MPELKDGCVKPASGPLIPVPESAVPVVGAAPSQEVSKILARDGLCCVSIQGISHSFDQPNWQRSLPSTRIFRRWALKCCR